MEDLIVIFRTPSQIEADVVKGLLDTHGIAALVTSDLSRTAFPFALNELRVAVNVVDAEQARRIIDSHREEVLAGTCRAVRQRVRAARAGRSVTASAIAACSNTRSRTAPAFTKMPAAGSSTTSRSSSSEIRCSAS